MILIFSFGIISISSSLLICLPVMKLISLFSEIFCPVLSQPKNGEVTAEWPVAPNEIAEFTCNPGFSLQGNKLLLCNRDGSWSHAQPVCEGLYLKCCLNWYYTIIDLYWGFNIWFCRPKWLYSMRPLVSYEMKCFQELLRVAWWSTANLYFLIVIQNWH